MSHGWGTFRRGSKNKSALKSNAATLLSNYVLFLQPDSSCPLRRKTCSLPIIAAILFTYLCATVIIGTLVARLNVFKSVSNNTSLNSPSQPPEKAFLVGVKPTILLGNVMSLLLVNIFLITPNVLLITLTTNFQFLPEVVLSFISPPWKLLLLNLSNLCFANKKNSFIL